ncbi:hypothetical protein DFH09DRAFT_1095512 [Mycena vulgaris]|nr:hypothetical protein DFH09DRAFT_1095512 [Mycena vulgaris]
MTPAEEKAQLKANRDTIKANPIDWSGDRPLCVRSKDGVDLFWLIPKALRGASHSILHTQLEDLARNVKLSLCSGADSKTDNTKVYAQTKGAHVGLYKLVKYWHAIATQSPDQQLLASYPPEFFVAVKCLHIALEKDIEYVITVGANDPVQVKGREIMYNRQTPLHRDKSDLNEGWAVLVAAGEFEGGRMHVPEASRVPLVDLTKHLYARGGGFPELSRWTAAPHGGIDIEASLCPECWVPAKEGQWLDAPTKTSWELGLGYCHAQTH